MNPRIGGEHSPFVAQALYRLCMLMGGVGGGGMGGGGGEVCERTVLFCIAS